MTMAEKITSPADLLAKAKQAQDALDLRGGAKDIQVTVHMGTCGIAAGARDVLAGFMAELAAAGVTNVSLHQSGCAGLCEQEPMITLKFEDGSVYHYGLLEDRDKIKAIVQQHIVGGQPVEASLIKSA
jgi:NADP-reducing hydrogenase subunit HndB